MELATSSLPQEVLNNLDSEEDPLTVIMDQPSTSTPASGPASSAFNVPASLVSSVPAHSISIYVNLVAPEGTDTEKVMDIFVTVITE